MYNNTIIIRVHVSRGNLRTSWAPSRRFTPYRTRPGPILGLGPLLPRLPSSSPYVHALKPYVVVVVITISYISCPYRAASFLSIILCFTSAIWVSRRRWHCDLRATHSSQDSRSHFVFWGRARTTTVRWMRGPNFNAKFAFFDIFQFYSIFRSFC